MEEKSNFDAFYPFFIIIVVYLVTFFKKRAKMKRDAEEKRRAPPVPIRREAIHHVATPPPSISTVKMVKLPTRKKTPPIKRKGNPRIVNLVQGLKSKKELVLLSEILSINSRVK